jgi:hypothetical protein
LVAFAARYAVRVACANARDRASAGNTGQKNASVDLGAMPADGFDAAAKKFGTSARPGGSSPRQWMDNTPVVRASEETNQNKPGAVVSVVGTKLPKPDVRSTVAIWGKPDMAQTA